MTNNFTWSNFGRTFLKAIVYSPSTPESARPAVETSEPDLLLPAMNAICSYPDQRFVMTYRHEIETVLMKSFPEYTNELAEVLGCRGNIIGSTVNNLASQTFSRSVIQAYVLYLLKIGGVKINGYTNRFVNITDIDLDKSVAGDCDLFWFQREAVSSLKTYFVEEDRQRGMLVLPTGSGKTRTAVYFLLRDMVRRGYQVLWLAHRYMLLEQAEEVFRNNAPLAKSDETSDKKTMRIITVSGAHRSTHELSKKDTIKIVGVQSAARNLAHIRSTLGEKVIIVIDEAHHGIAPSYQKIVDAVISKRPDAKLLGLTATPVRMTESGSRELMNMFDNTIIYTQSMKELIIEGFLSNPVCTRVHTNEDFESGLTQEEIDYIVKRHDMPESLIARIAASSTRNRLIVDTYLKNREKYGKTLIFAMNIPHCITLCEEFRRNGVSCDYIVSGDPNNHETIERFRRGEFEILINVNIMTEGSDVPDINTVFLTRQTESEGLLLQMIGRGMRGTSAHGTKTVNIVDFYDLWDRFNKWLDPSFLLDMATEPEQPAESDYHRRDVFRYTDKMCIDVYNCLKQKRIAAKELVTLPAAWYAVGDEKNEHRILVFDDQLSGYERMADDAEFFKNNEIPTDDIIKKYFRGFVTYPSEKDVTAFAGALRSGVVPQRYLLSDRDIIDPQNVSRDVTEQGLDFMSYAAELYEKYPVTGKLFGSLREYRSCIFEYLNDPDGKLRPPMKTVEIPYEKIPFDSTPVYDLNELVQEVTNEMFSGKYDGISSINWTDKPESRYFGAFYFADNHIVINCILNSRDVPREAVKYVIYHEMLHLNYPYHTKAFREQEHKYPEYYKWDQFLDGTFQDFDIKEM